MLFRSLVFGVYGYGLFLASPFVIGAATISDLALRVEIGFLAGSIVTTLVMAWALLRRMRHGVTEGIGSLIAQIEHEPLDL